MNQILCYLYYKIWDALFWRGRWGELWISMWIKLWISVWISVGEVLGRVSRVYQNIGIELGELNGVEWGLSWVGGWCRKYDLGGLDFPGTATGENIPGGLRGHFCVFFLLVSKDMLISFDLRQQMTGGFLTGYGCKAGDLMIWGRMFPRGVCQQVAALGEIWVLKNLFNVYSILQQCVSWSRIFS